MPTSVASDHGVPGRTDYRGRRHDTRPVELRLRQLEKQMPLLRYDNHYFQFDAEPVYSPDLKHIGFMPFVSTALNVPPQEVGNHDDRSIFFPCPAKVFDNADGAKQYACRYIILNWDRQKEGSSIPIGVRIGHRTTFRTGRTVGGPGYFNGGHRWVQWDDGQTEELNEGLIVILPE